MASLLERMDIDPGMRTTGPVRNRGGGARAGSVPYNRGLRNHGKADADAVWQHDMYKGGEKSLSARLTDASTSAPRKVDVSAAQMALNKSLGLSRGGGDLSIKGASSTANVVEVSGLVNGTTAADVEAIFKRCGAILKSAIHSSNSDSVTVRLTFKNSEDAKTAVNKFNGQSADGRVLQVSIIGSVNATLRGRLGLTANGTVDDLLDDDEGGSKMRSDAILKQDPRAQVIIVPPGANPAHYQQQVWRGGRGGRGGRGRRGGRGGGGGGAGMDVD